MQEGLAGRRGVVATPAFTGARTGWGERCLRSSVKNPHNSQLPPLAFIFEFARIFATSWPKPNNTHLGWNTQGCSTVGFGKSMYRWLAAPTV
jgi:hypothetical protein